MSLLGLNPRQALRAVRAALAGAGVPDAAFDARELLRAVTGRDPLLDERALTAPEAAQLEAFTARRAAREPLQYLLGSWDFLDFTLAVGPGVLCPRADTEVVCEAAAKALLAQGLAAPLAVDLCAGSGCLGLGVRRLVPNANVLCVEKSPQALCYLKKNADAALAPFGVPAPAVGVREGDVFTFYRELAPKSAALILSNPPYLTAAEMETLMPETAFEPAMALLGGADGLDFYRRLVRDYRRCLRPGGAMVLEIGYAQRESVFALAAEYGFAGLRCEKDLSGNDRAVILTLPDE